MTDQERFDQEVRTKGRVVLEALAGLGIFAALVMSMVALVQSGKTTAGTGTVSVAQRAATSSPATPAAAPKVIDLTVAPESKKGPEGKLHDAFSVTNFNVKVGQPVTLRIDNTDTVPHSITSAEAGVNIVAQPGTHEYTLQVSRAGRFEWNCTYPCDPWSMAHVGYMRGFITATTS